MMVFKPQSPWTAVPVLGLTLAIQRKLELDRGSMYILQLLTFGRSNHHQRTALWNKPLYLVYLSIAWAIQVWSILLLLHDTPLFNFVAHILGTTFHGKALFFGHHVYYFPLVDIADKTVIDKSSINGHYAIFQDITLVFTKPSK
jgi:hypothetical protein